jgi:hypothetical protein
MGTAMKCKTKAKIKLLEKLIKSLKFQIDEGATDERGHMFNAGLEMAAVLLHDELDAIRSNES